MSKKITPREVDYSTWYNDIIQNADLAENSGVRGCMVIKPYGYAIWEKMQAELDKKFKLLVIKMHISLFLYQNLIFQKKQAMWMDLQKNVLLLHTIA